MLTSLKEIYNILEDINQSISNKTELLIKYLNDPIFGKTLAKVLDYMTDPQKYIKLTKINNCIYFTDELAAENQNVDGIFKMLDYLIEKNSEPSDDEIKFLEKISSSDMETVEVVTRILIKFPGCGLTNENIREILESENKILRK